MTDDRGKNPLVPKCEDTQPKEDLDEDRNYGNNEHVHCNSSMESKLSKVDDYEDDVDNCLKRHPDESRDKESVSTCIHSIDEKSRGDEANEAQDEVPDILVESQVEELHQVLSCDGHSNTGKLSCKLFQLRFSQRSGRDKSAERQGNVEDAANQGENPKNHTACLQLKNVSIKYKTAEE